MKADIAIAKKSANPVETGVKTLTLSAQSVSWMQGKGEFARDVARLAKYWSQTILFDGKVFGMSYIIKLIAVKAALEEEKEEARRGRSEPTFVGALKKFLEKVKNLRRERIVFTDHFREADIPPEVRSQTPLLINPVNRYQNLLEQASSEFLDTFTKCANQSLIRLTSLMGPNHNGGQDATMALANLFKPQPLLFEFEKKKFVMTNAIVSPVPWDGELPKHTVNRQVWNDYNRQGQFSKILLVNMASNLNVYLWANPKATATDMQEQAKKVWEMMTGNTRGWIPAPGEKHESRGITFRFPTGNGKAQGISFDLKSIG